MKPEELEIAETCAGDPPPVTGDVIGDTAYSERFVLKILLKFANLDTLKEEIKEKAFEDDLCTLWDMAAERDVVLFLQKHDVLKLFSFALPSIVVPRIIEIIVGIIGNMCCQKEAVDTLLTLRDFIMFLLEYLKTDDSLLLIQVLRLVHFSLFVADDEDLVLWMELFKEAEYATSLYFILKNSSHKDLLITALENFNTVCSYCNTEKSRADFFAHFITPDSLESLCSAFAEVSITQVELCERDALERILSICLQILMNLIGFEKSGEIYSNNTDEPIKIISHVLNYYENKLVHLKEIDSDLVDIIESTNSIVETLQLGQLCNPETYFMPCYKMWTSVNSLIVNGNRSDFEEDNSHILQEFCNKIKPALCTLFCVYMQQCSKSDLLKVLDRIGSDFEIILSFIKDEELSINVLNKAANYRTRLKDNVDS